MVKLQGHGIFDGGQPKISNAGPPRWCYQNIDLRIDQAKISFNKHDYHTPPLNLRALLFVHADIRVLGPHPISMYRIFNPKKLRGIAVLTSERRSVFAGSLSKNSKMLPFSIHGETKHSLLST